MCTGFEVYQHYVALKNHFNGQFDYIKYKGKVKLSYGSYDNRKDKAYFEAISRKVDGKEVVPFLVANIMANDDIWIGDMIKDFDKSRQKFVGWKKRMVWLYQEYARDLSNIIEFIQKKNLVIKDLFVYNTHSHPAIFRMMMEGMIEQETFIILDDIIHFVKVNNKHLQGDIIWDREVKKLEFYKPFVVYDKSRCESITKIKFKN